MSTENSRGRAKSLARIAVVYCFMFFFGPVAWQLWMALRLGFVRLDESRRCLLSPPTVVLAALLFVLNVASLQGGVERLSLGGNGAAPRRMALHFASLLAFATIGTFVSMSALSGAVGGGLSPRLKIIVGSLNGGSMCFVFYAMSTASVIERLASPDWRPSGGGILALTRVFNAGLFAMGLPLFIATSLVAASLGGSVQGPGRTVRLLASLALPVTMGSVLFIRADKRIAALRIAVGKEFVR